MTLVLVDDDAAIRRAVGRFLRSAGHDVHVFESAETYLAERCDAACAILDVDLPGLSGFELEERLRGEGCQTPVVFVTAHDVQMQHAAAERAGATILRKPVDEYGLLDAIVRATSDRR